MKSDRENRKPLSQKRQGFEKKKQKVGEEEEKKSSKRKNSRRKNPTGCEKEKN